MWFCACGAGKTICMLLPLCLSSTHPVPSKVSTGDSNDIPFGLEVLHATYDTMTAITHFRNWRLPESPTLGWLAATTTINTARLDQGAMPPNSYVDIQSTDNDGNNIKVRGLYELSCSRTILMTSVAFVMASLRYRSITLSRSVFRPPPAASPSLPTTLLFCGLWLLPSQVFDGDITTVWDGCCVPDFPNSYLLYVAAEPLLLTDYQVVWVGPWVSTFDPCVPRRRYLECHFSG